jgi:acetoin utilization protein AcuC
LSRLAKLKIIFHNKYLDYSFGPGHPFWPERARLFINELKKSCLDFEILSPKKALKKDILLVHSRDYLNHLHRLAKTGGGVSPDTPVTADNLEAAYYSVGGSILCLKKSLKRKRAVNLLGGLHHAGIASGSGFCLLNDHAIAIRKIQKQGLIKKAMVYDLDVHAGQGTQEIFYRDPHVFTISLHQDPATLYPGTGFANERGAGPGRGFNLNLPLPPGTTEKNYLQVLDSVLPLTKKFSHDIIILVLGTDTFKQDPLANIMLEESSYKKIGERFKKFPKVAVMFAGGYSKKTPALWLNFLQGYL